MHTVRYNVRKLSSNIIFDNDESIKFVKERIIDGIVENLKQFIERDIEDVKMYPSKIFMRGTIF